LSNSARAPAGIRFESGPNSFATATVRAA